MKNGTCVKECYYCWHCKTSGFFCYTPMGADFKTCPCCGENDYLNTCVNYVEEPTKYDFLFEDEYENDMRYVYRFCENCKIIFELGCTHFVGGCTDNVYNCHFIKRWRDKSTNIEYNGMPQFEDADDWFNNVNNVEILEMCCPHNNNKCTKTFYPVIYNCNLPPINNA